MWGAVLWESIILTWSDSAVAKANGLVILGANGARSELQVSLMFSTATCGDGPQLLHKAYIEQNLNYGDV